MTTRDWDSIDEGNLPLVSRMSLSDHLGASKKTIQNTGAMKKSKKMDGYNSYHNLASLKKWKHIELNLIVPHFNSYAL